MKKFFNRAAQAALIVCVAVALAAAVAALAPSARAADGFGAQGLPVSSANNFTNRLAGSSSATNTTGTVFSVPDDADSLEIQFRYEMTAGGATNQTLWIEKSVNGTDWVAVSPIAVAAQATAGNASTIITNIPSTVLAPYFRFPVVTNAFGTPGHFMTNYSVTVRPRR